MPTLEGKFGCALGSPKKRSDLFLFYLIGGHVGFVRDGDIFLYLSKNIKKKLDGVL